MVNEPGKKKKVTIQEMGGTPQYYFRCLNHIHLSNKVMLLDFTFTHTTA